MNILGNIIGMMSATLTAVLGTVFNLMRSGFSMTMKFQEQGIAYSRQLGQNVQEAHAYTKVLISRTHDLAAKYGVTSEAIHAVQEAITSATNRQLILNNAQQEGLLQLSKLAGSEAVSKFTDEIMNGMGGQIQTVEKAVSKAYVTAAKSGLNAQAVTKKIADNLSMANRLSFRNGLDGLTKMAIQAEKVGMSMQSVESVARNFLDIGDAIQHSAELQMLGGSAGVFGSNPLAMAFEANYDPEALQKRMTGMLGGLAQFNAKTGMSSVGGMNMDILRNMAKAMGMDESEAVKVAKKNAELKYKENQFGNARGGLTQEQWDFVMNKSFVENGRLFMTDKDGEKHNISGGISDFGLFSEMMKYENMSDHDIMAQNARTLTDIQSEITGWQERIVAKFAQAFEPYMPNIKASVKKVMETLSGLAEPLANGVAKGISGIAGFISDNKETIKAVLKKTVGFFQWMFEMAEKWPKTFITLLIAHQLAGPALVVGAASLIGKTVGSAVNLVFKGIGGLFKTGGRLGGGAMNVGKSFFGWVSKAGKGFGNMMKSAGSKITSQFAKILPSIKSNAKSVGRALAQGAKSVGKWIGSKATKLWNKIPKGVVKGGVAAIAGAVGNGLVDYSLEKGKISRGGFAHTAGRTASTAAEWAGMGAMLGSVIPGVGTTLGAAIGGIAGGAKGYYDSYKEWKEDPKNANAGFKDYVGMQVTEIGNWIKDKLSKNAELILNIFMPWRILIKNWDSITNWFGNALKSVVENVGAFFSKLWGLLREYNPLALARKGTSWLANKVGFAEGGIVGGNSYTGDKNLIRVNSGEMVLNKESQASLWNFIRGASSAIVGTTPIGAVAERIYKPNSSSSMDVNGSRVTVRDFNVNISGTIRLDGGNGGANVNVRDLLSNTSFVSSLKDLIKESINNDINGGRFMSDTPSRRGMPSQTGIWGKK